MTQETSLRNTPSDYFIAGCVVSMVIKPIIMAGVLAGFIFAYIAGSWLKTDAGAVPYLAGSAVAIAAAAPFLRNTFSAALQYEARARAHSERAPDEPSEADVAG